MARRLATTDDDFKAAFDALVEGDRDAPADVAAAVAAIIAAVRDRGFAAAAELTALYDGWTPNPQSARVDPAEIDSAERQTDPATLDALDLAAARIRSFHERQKPSDFLYKDDVGVDLGWRWTAVDAAGLYAPGGRAAYPSSVLMNAIPAKAAGVSRLVLCVPAPKGEINPLVLVAARRAGVDEIWKIGGAQAIAALAFGAAPIARVDMIAGPGNAYVAEAKRQVFGRVGIDAIAGPSEIVVVADAGNPPDWIAADLMSQAEHDPSSQCILLTDDAGFADRVEAATRALLERSSRRAIAEAAWRKHGAVVVLRSLDEAPALVDALAPEHVELAVADPAPLLAAIRHAGAIFLGRHTPEALGDYLAGPNHVLPTSRAARYASGLSVLSFMKRTTIVGADVASLRAIGPAAAILADAEGLPAHADSVRLRLR
ncbi:MAG: histidinol dehydrogenase [Parvularculaceae bacterium]|nr:histidinol dehydrogenase [Parvularculaceae bacterium]